MSARGPRDVEPRFYGGTYRFEIVRRPNKILAVGAFMIALSLACGALLMRDDHWGGREVLVALSMPFLFVIGVLALHGSWMLRSAPPVFVKLGLKKLVVPRGTFAWTLAEEEVPLRDVGPISRVFSRHGDGIDLEMPDGKKVRIRDDWFPPDRSPMDFAFLLQMRRELALRRKIDRARQTALEAQVFEGDADTLGVVVDTRKKRPKPIALIDDLDDYEALLARQGFPHDQHQLVVPDDRVAAARDALADRIVASVDVDPEKVRAQRRSG